MWGKKKETSTIHTLLHTLLEPKGANKSGGKKKRPGSPGLPLNSKPTELST